jgi:Leucine-rich repeat (LRR) protein
MTPLAARQRARWYRLSLRLSVRAFMVVVLVVGGLLGWAMHRARVRREALAAIQQAAIQDAKDSHLAAARHALLYDWEWADETVRERLAGATPPRRSRMSIALLGFDGFRSVKAVDLSFWKNADDALMQQVGRLDQLEAISLGQCPSVTDAGLGHLRGQSRLKALDLSGTSITGAGLKHLRGMRQLESLNLIALEVKDADLQNLGKLTALEHLCVSGAQISDTGLAHLRELTRLRDLTLATTKVTSLLPIAHLTGLENLVVVETPINDSGLAPIANFTKLTSLNLHGTEITDATMTHIARLTGLTHLELDDTPITDAGIVKIAGLTKLKSLGLSNTEASNISDRSLECLAGMEQLLWVNAYGTKVTAAGIARFNARRRAKSLAPVDVSTR